MLRFKDFVPELAVIDAHGHELYASFEEAVAAAGQWLKSTPARVIQLETVVLPNIWAPNEGGSSDPSLRTWTPASWHQFVRVWYDDDPSAPYR